jgi:hypothetical protein
MESIVKNHKMVLLELAAMVRYQLREREKQLLTSLVERQVTVEDFEKARDKYLVDELYKRPANEPFFKTVSIVLQLAKPSVTLEDEASEASARIFAAVKKYGWCNRDEAKEFIGSVGWAVVENNGGWTNLCQTLQDRMIPTLTAQYRELAKTQIKKAKTGTLGEAPQLEGGFEAVKAISSPRSEAVQIIPKEPDAKPTLTSSAEIVAGLIGSNEKAIEKNREGM